MKKNDRAAAIEEMMTNTVRIQNAYKEKVMALIAIQDKQIRAAGAQVQNDFSANRLMLILLAVFSIGMGSLMGWYIVRMITRPLGEAVGFAEAIAEGDLTRTIDARHRDETGILLRALMEMKNRPRVEIVHQVQNGSESISSAAAQIVAGNQDPAARTEEQASSVEQTAASMEQITATVKNTADHTSEASQLSAGAATVVKTMAR